MNLSPYVNWWMPFKAMVEDTPEGAVVFPIVIFLFALLAMLAVGGL